MGKKCPLKSVALEAERNGWTNESVAKHSAMGWPESIKWDVKTPAIAMEGGGMISKAMRRTTTKWRTSTNKDTTTTKWRWQPTLQKPPWRFSQAKYHSWEFLTFDFKKIITELIIKKFLYKKFIKIFFENIYNKKFIKIFTISSINKFFVYVIYWCKEAFFVKNIFIIISSKDKWAS